MILGPTENTILTENPIFTMWIDKTGILCFISKKHSGQTIEETKKLFQQIRLLSNNEKKCMLMDVTHFHLPSKESREYGAIELPKMIKAIAFLSNSSLGAFVTNLFFKLKPQPYPVKVFTTEEEAREWLKQYL